MEKQEKEKDLRKRTHPLSHDLDSPCYRHQLHEPGEVWGPELRGRLCVFSLKGAFQPEMEDIGYSSWVP